MDSLTGTFTESGKVHDLNSRSSFSPLRTLWKGSRRNGRSELALKQSLVWRAWELTVHGICEQALFFILISGRTLVSISLGLQFTQSRQALRSLCLSLVIPQLATSFKFSEQGAKLECGACPYNLTGTAQGAPWGLCKPQ